MEVVQTRVALLGNYWGLRGKLFGNSCGGGAISCGITGEILGTLDLWDALGRSGTVWAALGRSGALWGALGSSGTPWGALGRSGTLWDALERSGTLCGALGRSRQNGVKWSKNGRKNGAQMEPESNETLVKIQLEIFASSESSCQVSKRFFDDFTRQFLSVRYFLEIPEDFY